MSNDPGICICTSSTPWWPLAVLLPKLAAAGHHGIELGVKPHQADPAQPANCWTNNHGVLSVDALERQQHRLRDDLAQHDLRLAAIGSYHDANDLAAHRRLAVIAQNLGCTQIRATVPHFDAALGYARHLSQQRLWWRDLAQMGADHGVRFIVELHDCTITPSASAAMRLLDGLPTNGCGVILDVANTMAEGNEALPMAVDILGSYLAHVHVKQRTFQRRTQPYQGSIFEMAITPLTSPGDVPWPAVIAILRNAGYSGWWSIEDFTRLDEPDTRLRDNAAWMRQLLHA